MATGSTMQATSPINFFIMHLQCLSLNETSTHEQNINCLGQIPRAYPKQQNQRPLLEVEAQLHALRARSNEVGPAESGEEVVQREFIRHVDGGEAQAPLITVAVE